MEKDLFDYEGVDSPEYKMRAIILAMMWSNPLNRNWKGLFMAIWGSNSLNTDWKEIILAMRRSNHLNMN